MHTSPALSKSLENIKLLQFFPALSEEVYRSCFGSYGLTHLLISDRWDRKERRAGPFSVYHSLSYKRLKNTLSVPLPLKCDLLFAHSTLW